MTASAQPSARRLWRKAAVVWLALSALLATTIVCAYLPLGNVKLAVSLGIAVIKALLVAIVFMELREDGAVIRMAAVVGILWLGVLIALLLAEAATRQHGVTIFGSQSSSCSRSSASSGHCGKRGAWVTFADAAPITRIGTPGT